MFNPLQSPNTGVGGEDFGKRLEEGIPLLESYVVPEYWVISRKEMLKLAKQIAKEHGNAFITSDKRTSDVYPNHKTIAVIITDGPWMRLVIEKEIKC